MKNILVIYWSGTGNTEKMAKAVAEGANSEQTQVQLLTVSQASSRLVEQADCIALGCPSMGAEVLEEYEMEPFMSSIEAVIKGKPLALFGSYGWGSGQWMFDWEERVKTCGAILVTDGLIINDTPDAKGLEKCRALGAKLAKYPAE